MVEPRGDQKTKAGRWAGMGAHGIHRAAHSSWPPRHAFIADRALPQCPATVTECATPLPTEKSPPFEDHWRA